jgi:membrane associated rhomboid family serine protease
MRITKRVSRTSFSATSVLIFANVAFFIIFYLTAFLLGQLNESRGAEFLEQLFALQPQLVAQGHFWTLLTSMFMHAGIGHLVINMISLFFIGSLLERIIGRKRFVWVYLISGLVAGLFFVAFAYLGTFIPRGDYLFGSISDYAVGASGALFGLLGVLATLLPNRKIYLLTGPIVVIILQVLVSSLLPEGAYSIIGLVANLLVFLMIISIFYPSKLLRTLSLPMHIPFWLAPILAIVPVVLLSFFIKLPIGNTAHFGGLVAGVLYGLYLRTKYSKKVALLNRMFK